MEFCWGYDDAGSPCEETAVTTRRTEDGHEPFCASHAESFDKAEDELWERMRAEHKHAPCQYCRKVTHDVDSFRNVESDNYGLPGAWGVDWVCRDCRNRQYKEWQEELEWYAAR